MDVIPLLVKGIASDGLHSGHDDLGQAVGIPECVFSDFRHTLRQIHGDNSACVKGVLSDAGNTVGDGHRGDIFFPDEHMSPDGGDAGIPRNIHLCVVPAVPLQDAVQDDEVAVYHLDDPIFLRTAELLAVYIDDGFDLAAVLGLSVTVKLAPGALVTQLTIRWARFRVFPLSPPFPSTVNSP